MATPKIVPRAQGGGSLGDTDYGWGGGYITSTAASSATAGGLLEIGCNDGAVMADNHRLGVIEFKGAEDTNGTLSVGARVQAICNATWASDTNSADLEFYTTAGTTESIKALVSTTGVTSINKRTVWIGEQHFVAASTAGGVKADKEYHATDSGTLRESKYDKATKKYMDFVTVMPEQWDLGNLKVKFYWVATGGGRDRVKWGIQCRGLEDGASMTTGFGTAVAVIDNSLGNELLQISPSSGVLGTGSGTRLNDSLLLFRVFRDAGDGTDDFDADARLVGILVEYTEKIVPHTPF